MASTKTSFPPPPNFILSPHQQDLLFAALNSNNKSPATQALAPMAFDNSPLQAPPSATITNLDDSPFIDYDYDFENDASFGDYDFTNLPQGQMIGNLPGTSSEEGDTGSHDKRGHSEDDDDEEPDGKRREGDDKMSKKPGRKPLTSEPTTKRKAQNRAAQRAFRERKEKHLKDLETKVQDLEKASESANHENLILRSRVEKMSAELKEYKKRVGSQPTNGTSVMPGLPSYLKGPHANNPNDVDFSFEFPKFGRLPGPPVSFSKSDSQLPTTRSTTSPTNGPSRATSFASNISPLDVSHPSMSFGNRGLPQTTQDISQFSSIFTPSLDGVSDNFDYMAHMGNDVARSSTDSTNATTSTGHNTSHSSPASSNSNHGLSSSCGTTPEPYTQSPAAPKPECTLTTIGEERDSLSTENSFCEKLAHVCGNPNNPIPRTMADAAVPSSAFDINSLDWLAQQNGNQFDPQLFGDYREPQDNVLTGGLYDDTFFNEAFAMPVDFTASPFTLEAGLPAAAAAAVVHPAKRDLVGEIDAKLSAEEEVVPAESEMLTCTNMWEKIQACPRVQNGEIDMDSLCTQLQQKAKCSGEGPVIQERDFKDVLNTMFLAKGLPPCEEK